MLPENIICFREVFLKMSLKLGVEVMPIREDREEMLEKDYGLFLVSQK